MTMAKVASLAAYEVILLCGGRGTRLGSLTTNTPKPLLPIGGTPFLLRRLQALRDEGVTRMILSTQFLAEQFEIFQHDYAEALPGLELVQEPEPLGTGGALRLAATYVRSTHVIVMNGDSWIDQPLAPVIADHLASGRAFTMTLVRADHIEGNAHKKGVVMLGPHHEITGFSTQDAETGWINAGLYVARTSFLLGWPEGAYDLEQRFLSLVPPTQSHVFCSDQRLIDIGTPDAYAHADAWLR